MKFSRLPTQQHASRRHGGPAARLLLVLLLVPPCGGCWWQQYRRDGSSVDSETAAGHYYQEAVANTAGPYNSGVEFEIPTNPPPLTSRNPEGEEKWELTLQEVIEIALKNSEVLRRRVPGGTTVGRLENGEFATRYAPGIAETEILQRLAQWDTQLIFNLFWAKDKVQINNNVAGGSTITVVPGVPFIFEQDSFGGAAGRNTGEAGTGDVLTIRKPLSTGGQVTFGFNTDYDLTNISGNRAFQAAYNTRFFTTFRQPLLQGAGVELNRIPLVIARLNSDITLFDFKRSLGEFIRDVEQVYWELCEAQRSYSMTNEIVDLYRQFVKSIEFNLEAGREPANDSDLAEAEFQLHRNRRTRVFELSRLGQDRSDVSGILLLERQLRQLIGLPISDGRRIVAVSEPQVAPIDLQWQALVEEAFTHNPIIQRQKLELARRREVLKALSDGLRPRLDFIIRKEIQGLGTEFDDSIREVNHENLGSLTAGLQFQYDFGYQQAAARVQEARLRLEEGRGLVRESCREVENELAQAYQLVVAASETYSIGKSALAAAERHLKLQKFLFENGRTTIDRVVRAVENFALALREHMKDQTDFVNSLANLELAKGTIFQFNNIHVHEGVWAARAYPQSAKQSEDRARAIEWYSNRPQNVEMSERVSTSNQSEPRASAASGADMPTYWDSSSKQVPARPVYGPPEITVNVAGRQPAKDQEAEAEAILTTGFDSEVIDRAGAEPPKRESKP